MLLFLAYNHKLFYILFLLVVARNHLLLLPLDFYLTFGRKILNESGLAITAAKDLGDAAVKVVAAAKGV